MFLVVGGGALRCSTCVFNRHACSHASRRRRKPQVCNSRLFPRCVEQYKQFLRLASLHVCFKHGSRTAAHVVVDTHVFWSKLNRRIEGACGADHAGVSGPFFILFPFLVVLKCECARARACTGERGGGGREGGQGGGGARRCTSQLQRYIN
jgi:hypothetical protein